MLFHQKSQKIIRWVMIVVGIFVAISMIFLYTPF